MPAQLPANKPQNGQAWFTQKLNDTLTKFGYPIWDGKEAIILGCEMYYSAMGKTGKNDRAMYDDAMAFFTQNVFMVINANTDPSAYRPGHGHGSAKGMGNIHYGVHRGCWAVGAHKKIYPALRQVSTIVARRDADKQVPESDIIVIDDDRYYLETGDYQAMNNHPGGVNGTSSLGCQTVPRAQWDMWISTIVAELKRLNQKKVTYVKDRIRG